MKALSVSFPERLKPRFALLKHATSLATWTRIPILEKDAECGPAKFDLMMPMRFLCRVRSVNCLLAGGANLGGFPSRSMAWRRGSGIRDWNVSGGSVWRGGRRVG